MDDANFERYVQQQLGPTEADWERTRIWLGMCARQAWLYFTALKAEGFPDEAALRIIIAHGVMPKFPPQLNLGQSSEDA